jgi:hypothetical protein
VIEALENIHVMDSDPVATEHVQTALTAGGFIYGDGATQVFEPAGATTYVQQGQQTRGEWISTTVATSARSGRRAIEPATSCAGSSRKAESLASDSPN